MAKKKASKLSKTSKSITTLVRAAAKRKAKAKRNPISILSNPVTEVLKSTIVGDVAAMVGPGVAGYAANRIIAGLVAGKLSTMIPFLGRHMKPIMSLVTAVAEWYATGKWKAIAKYQESVLVGAGIAVIHTVVETYLPGLAWLTGSVQQPAQVNGNGSEDVDVDSLLDESPAPVKPQAGLGAYTRTEALAAQAEAKLARDEAEIASLSGPEDDILFSGVFTKG